MDEMYKNLIVSICENKKATKEYTDKWIEKCKIITNFFKSKIIKT